MGAAPQFGRPKPRRLSLSVGVGAKAHVSKRFSPGLLVETVRGL